MRDFLNYGSSIDIKILFLTLAFIIIWKFFIEKNDLEKHNNRELLSAISELDQRSKEILVDRWLSDIKPTLHELSDKYGVSAERIRQIEKSAMDVIKEKLS